MTKALRVGLISDTHGLLRPEALEFLRGCDRIVHGGDICDPSVLAALVGAGAGGRGARQQRPRRVGRSAAVRERVQIGEVLLYAVHDIADLDIDPRAEGVRVVVSGHSHKPSVSERDGVLYVNPGSAGPRRFKLPIALGELAIEGREVTARIVELER